MPLRLELTNDFSHWWAPTISVWGLLLHDGWFPTVQAVSSTRFCYAFLEHYDHAFLLRTCRRRLHWACVCVPFFWRGQPSAAEAKLILCWAGTLSCWLLRLAHSLAIWCLGGSASSVGETAQVAWSASGRKKQVSAPYRREGMTSTLYTRIFMDRRSDWLPHSLWQSSKGTAGFGHAVIKILADCGISTDDAISSVTKVFHCVEIGAIDADLRRIVRLVVEWFGTTPQSSSGWW